MRWLLSYTAQQASGLAAWQRDTDHIEKAFDFGGMPAQNGVTAALLVVAGGTAVDDIFSGADNFFQAFGPINDPATLTEGLGTSMKSLARTSRNGPWERRFRRRSTLSKSFFGNTVSRRIR
jgi:hypothetical protein